MEIKDLEKLTKNLYVYSASDVKDLTFMTDDELEIYQAEVERDSGNLSDWDHLRAVLTFKNKILKLEECKKGLIHGIVHMKEYRFD